MAGEIFRVMLAKDAELDKLRFPLLASAKLDGVRAYVRGGVVLSRSNKPIPNKFVQDKFKAYEHFDGELIFGDPTAKDCYSRTVSAVMSQSTDGVDVNFYVFDHVAKQHERYHHRMPKAGSYNLRKGVIPHEQLLCSDLEDVLVYEQKCLEALS